MTFEEIAERVIWNIKNECPVCLTKLEYRKNKFIDIPSIKSDDGFRCGSCGAMWVRECFSCKPRKCAGRIDDNTCPARTR